MAVVKLIVGLRNDMADTIIAKLSAGSGAGKAKFYDGTQPAGPGTAITTQTLLGTLTLSDPAGAVSGGVLTFDVITDDSSADASGTASFVRFTDSDDNAVIDLDVTNNAGTGAVKMNTTTIVTGGPIRITSATCTIGGA